MGTSESEKDNSFLRKLILEIVESLELIKKIKNLESSQKGNFDIIEKKIKKQETILKSTLIELQKNSIKIETLLNEIKTFKTTWTKEEKKRNDQLNKIKSLINDKHLDLISRATSFSNDVGKILGMSSNIVKALDNNPLNIPILNSSKMEKKYPFKMLFSAAAFLLITSIVILIFIVPTQNFIKNLNQANEDVIKKIEKSDSIYFVSVQQSITNQLDTFKFLTSEEKVNLKRTINSQISNRNEIFINEINKENNRLMRDVIIINLIGRYTIILCCIIASVLILRSFADSKSKDDFFE